MKKIHKNKRKCRDINSIVAGSWEQANVPLPPANKSKSLQKILSQINREQNRRYWQDHHGIPRNEYLNSRRCPMHSIPGGLVQETSKLNW